jgi:hypothetical protein
MNKPLESLKFGLYSKHIEFFQDSAVTQNLIKRSNHNINFFIKIRPNFFGKLFIVIFSNRQTSALCDLNQQQTRNIEVTSTLDAW